MNLRRWTQRIGGPLLALALACGAGAALAETYPSRPLKLLVGFSPGGATDQLARLYAQKLTERLGQSVVVENRAGAGGNLAVQLVTQSPADGYTLVMAANYVAVNAALKRNPYEWERDLAPVALVASTPNLLVVPAQSKLKSYPDLVAAAKAPGNRLSFGSPGMGSSVHLAGELFKVMTSVDMLHVPYKGVAPAELDLMAGNIDLMFDSISTAAPLAEAGKLRAIAVTGMQRLNALPGIPTLDELGLKGFDVEATYMVLAPAKTPADVLERLSAAVAAVSRMADVQRVVEGLYARPLAGGAEETRAFLRAEEAKWRAVVKSSGLKID
ncbi:tripartite tricarboxylate transporter substrate binding protein [Pseudorhodoferax sp.]|uniref:tripartite tricarboxylate transporter substrate binding protein n=1 Tax=Pseudorhodoferax sp. TaxID=1993553 RepID=UPI002DD68878|nr:tripartite tricarboxylate transporter substrate binding protein [Pseudorhodoferax sp.]